MPSDVRELTGGVPYHHIEVESPIPPERRRIYSMPTEAALSYPTPHKELAEHLDKLLDDFKDIRPAMVHLPYADAFKVAQLMRTPVLTHDKDTKKEVLAEWLKNGGVLIGSGMTTGLDLKDDLCRLNIVGKVLYPSIASEFWKKKLALPGGKQAYALSALRSLVQALGRSTRSEKDWSVSILLDKRWISLYRAVKDEVPTFLKEAIVWQTVTPDQILADVEALK
jgi:Rad3-related DNA helicase